jgi:rifampin ADP-ribosylating transferase
MRDRYFHGGNRKLQVGEYVLPPSETGVRGMGELNPLCRDDRVYVTRNIVDARFFASASPSPVVYEVVPEEIEPDPDCNEPGVSFACQRAKIIAIHKIPGTVVKKNRKMMLRAKR